MMMETERGATIEVQQLAHEVWLILNPAANEDSACLTADECRALGHALLAAGIHLALRQKLHERTTTEEAES